MNLEIIRLIISFFVSKKISLVTLCLCWEKEWLIKLTKLASDAEIRLQIQQIDASYAGPAFEFVNNYAEGIAVDLSCQNIKLFIDWVFSLVNIVSAAELLTEMYEGNQNPAFYTLLANLILNLYSWSTKQASNSRLFDVKHSWYLFDKNLNSSSKDLDRIFSNTIVLPDADVTVKINGDLFDIYKAKVGDHLVKNKYKNEFFSLSSKDQQLVWSTQIPRTSRRKNLFGVRLKATTIISQPQYFLGWDDTTMKHIDTWPKLTYPLLKNLANDINIEINLRQIDNYGVETNGSFDGLVGELQRQEIEFGIASMFLRKDRWTAVDFCSETLDLRGSFLFRQPPKSTVSNIFLLPFSTGVWSASTIFFATAAAAMFTLRFKMLAADETLSIFTPSELFSFVIGTVCQQGSHVTPVLASARIITFFMFITSLFIFTSYSAKIVALLQTPSTAIKTVADIDHSPMAVGVQETTYKKVYFEESTDVATQNLFKHKIKPQGEKAYMSVIDGIEKMRRNLFAFQVERASAYSVMSRTFTEREKCGLAEIEAFKLPMVAVPIKKRSGYKELFATRLRWQREIGIIDRERKIWIAQKPQCNEGSTGFVSVGLTECLPAFKIMILGSILSVFMFIFEGFYNKFLEGRQLFYTN